MGAAQPSQRFADGGGRGAADAGVDLVEHQRARRLDQHQSQRQHGARQLAARCDLGQRQRWCARVGSQHERDVVAGVVARRPRPPTRARGMASSRSPDCDGLRPAVSARRATSRHRRRRSAALVGDGRVAARSRAVRPPGRSPRARRGGRGSRWWNAITSASVSPYLRRRLRNSCRRSVAAAKRAGIVVDRTRRRRARSAATSVSSATAARSRSTAASNGARDGRAPRSRR